MPTETASNKSVVSPGGAGFHIPEGFAALLTAGTDEVFKRGFEFPFEGEMFYSMQTTQKDTETFQSVVGLGDIGQNRDADDLPSDEQALGFPHSITTYVFRGKTGHERRLIEDELYGQVRDNVREMMEGSRRTVEKIMADGVNRGDGATASTGAPFLCEDGNYWFDAGRNNPHPHGGTWSNVEATSAITPTSIFTAQLNFAKHVNERGERDQKNMVKCIVRPDEEVEVFEIKNSDLRPTDAMNAANFQFGRFEYSTYNLMTTKQIVYMAEGRNEIRGYWRAKPSVVAYTDGNPDVLWQRVRFRCGIGGLRPDTWRAGVVT